MNGEVGLVSVIIPSFNRIKYIEKTVSSVLFQSYRKFEIIVVDDGSSDGSYGFLKDLEAKESKVSLYFHDDNKNKGQSASINLGIKKANGEFVVILDSDDYLDNKTLERHVNFLNRNKDVDIVYGNGAAVDKYGNYLNFNTLPENHVEVGDPNCLLLNCYIALPGGSMVRSFVYCEVGDFEESFRAGQDHDMALRIFEKYKVAYLPEIAFYYRKHAEAISNNGLERRWRTGFEILKRASARYPYSASIVRRREAVLNFRLGQVLFKNGSFIQSTRYFFKAAVLDPLRAAKVVLGFEKSQ
ncbi:glycosyltransferase [Marinobacter sp. BGYM27]|uniref:glycosyltransferase family 2 protein n=1 Tax=Marinobacter sp. BGYM27 TaxID=2975597 RepID=UPI0021A7C7E7|nr:glycosyltransferase [Marinobacter sp. BGYM27]MDG5499009.1 glycosyltransferase [Marinobacter sp. BGYM27]